MLHSSINKIVLTIIFLMKKKNNKEKEQREKLMRGSVRLTKYQKGEIGLNLKSQFSIEFLIYL